MAHPANTRFLYISAGFFLVLIVLLLTHHRDELAQHVTLPFKADSNTFDSSENQYPLKNPEEKVAFATWYSSTVNENGDNWQDDVYFTATRMLAYQLLHDPKTKTRNNIPFIILCTPDVSEARRARLAKDGATIHPVDWLTPNTDWMQKSGGAQRETWHDIMSKLHVYELTDYSRVLLIDGDTLLQSPLDQIFDDPMAQLMQTNNDPELTKDDEAPLPEKYLLASTAEVEGPDHSFPPTDEEVRNPDYFCAGFFMLAPSKEMYEHVVSVMNIEDRFSPLYMEQNLLNYVHRRDGPMPWTGLDRTWNIRDLNENDLDGGVVSAHMKWWEEPLSHHQKVKDWFLAVRWKMEGYYQGYDELKGKFPKYIPATTPPAPRATMVPSSNSRLFRL
ncbi:nucleotide-diphospho-sugar transferase [Pseudovirgaria hyperparasitica]|uniref:Nucleotide-diphospho-sugar transferase n=1 Tax=Pseudovirgaria hyperparasitica TaxID=470096 RepID=A0A6A6W766_9PEZI|nr:nucleotide-diphospho-sugar transferase [Pseudovirgaria hyperparasitica]KAF2756921.1 nucleotide-diphospho-sugar transferase [Pseudovirgaria hyperparasitica]